MDDPALADDGLPSLDLDAEALDALFQSMEDASAENEQRKQAFLSAYPPQAVEPEQTGVTSFDDAVPASSVPASSVPASSVPAPSDPSSSVPVGNEDLFFAADFAEFVEAATSRFNSNATGSAATEGSQNPVFDTDFPLDWASALGEFNPGDFGQGLNNDSAPEPSNAASLGGFDLGSFAQGLNNAQQAAPANAAQLGGFDLGSFGFAQGMNDAQQGVPSNNAALASTTSQTAPPAGPVSRLGPETWINRAAIPSTVDAETRARMIEIIRASAALLNPITTASVAIQELQRRSTQTPNRKPQKKGQKRSASKKADKRSPKRARTLLPAEDTPRQSSQENGYVTAVSIAPRQPVQENPYAAATSIASGQSLQGNPYIAATNIAPRQLLQENPYAAATPSTAATEATEATAATEVNIQHFPAPLETAIAGDIAPVSSAETPEVTAATSIAPHQTAATSVPTEENPPHSPAPLQAATAGSTIPESAPETLTAPVEAATATSTEATQETTASIAPGQASQENPDTTSTPTVATEANIPHFPAPLETGIAGSTVTESAPETLETLVPIEATAATTAAAIQAHIQHLLAPLEAAGSIIPEGLREHLKGFLAAFAEDPTVDIMGIPAGYQTPPAASNEQTARAAQMIERFRVTKQKLPEQGAQYFIANSEVALIEYTGFSQMMLAAVHDNTPGNKAMCIDDVFIIITPNKIVFARIHCTMTADEAIECARVLTGMFREWLDGALPSAKFYLLSPQINGCMPFYGFHKDQWDRRCEGVTECIRAFAQEFNAPFYFQPYFNEFRADVFRQSSIRVGPWGQAGDENRPHVMIADLHGMRRVRDSL